MKVNYILKVAIVLSLFVCFSCSSVPMHIDNNLTEELFFKNAQAAMELNQYNLALYYYEVYLIRYPELHKKTIAAEYERAFIYYKTKKYDYSRTLFKEILNKYENSPFTIMYPERFKVLSEKLILLIDEKMNKIPKTKNQDV